jgi:thiamine-monophosphate kinase
MSLGELEIISRYFGSRPAREDVHVGIGDDAAVLDSRVDKKLVLAMDTIVEGVHFLAGTAASDIGYRALAVNLSDLAAMGAIPSWMSLSLSLPHGDASWLQGFASGLFELADRFDVQLIGGDTVRGPLVVTIQVGGWIEPESWLTRSGAKIGDGVFVSGTLGEAAAGLALLRDRVASGSDAEYLRSRFLRPEPRVSFGRSLRSFASAAMDVSDGLLTDLGKLCSASGCGASIDIDSLPDSPPMRALFDEEQRLQFSLAGGDDYELLFTASTDQVREVMAADRSGVGITQIGVIDEQKGVRCVRKGVPHFFKDTGYDHFMSAKA